MTATLHDIARYYRNAGLVGEDKAALTSLIALAGDASVIWRGYPGTGKTEGAKITVSMLPPEIVCRVDMLSKLGIWSKGIAQRIQASRIVFFPEDQNAGDNDEVVKVKKKWGDGDDAERGKSTDYGNSTDVETLPCRTFISTAAITNDAHEKSFDLESARRVVKVSTDPSSEATARVLASKADDLVKGASETRYLSALDVIRVRRHVSQVFTTNHEAITRVRFFGAHQLEGAIPKSFPEARSAFALFSKILLGTARFHADAEVRVGSEVFLCPQRVAEAWSFYGDVIVENALKWDTSDREILASFPRPKWNGEAPAPECCLDKQALMKKLVPKGLTDPALVTRQLGRLEMKGFVAEAEGFRTRRWHRTELADVANGVDWAAVIAACEEGAKTYLEGDAREAYLAKCEAARGPAAVMNPMTGRPGPLVGTPTVLQYDQSTGTVVSAPPAAKRGIDAWK